MNSPFTVPNSPFRPNEGVCALLESAPQHLALFAPNAQNEPDFVKFLQESHED